MPNFEINLNHAQKAVLNVVGTSEYLITIRLFFLDTELRWVNDILGFPRIIFPMF